MPANLAVHTASGPLLETWVVRLASAAQPVAKLLQDPARLADKAASEAQDTLTEVGAVRQASSVKFTAHPPLSTATLTLAFGPTAVMEDSAMAMATDTAKDTAKVLKDMAQGSSQYTAVMAMHLVCLVSEQLVLRGH